MSQPASGVAEVFKVPVATLICVYGGDDPDLFATALASVIGQTGIAPEDNRVYLHIDGPVGPDLEKVVANHAGALRAVLRSDEGIGLAEGLNLLIDVLEDEQFVFRMDADDQSEPDRYVRQIAFLNDHPDVDIVGGAIRERLADGRTRVIHFPPSHEHCVRAFPYRSPLSHPTVCFRRSVFETGIRYPVSKRNQDIGLWFVCAERGIRFANMPEVVLQFTVNRDFWGRRSFDKSVEELMIYWRGLRRLKSPPHHYLFPGLRFLMRIAPKPVSVIAYAARERWWRP